MTSTRPHIAIVVPGGIGTGRDNIGVPVLEQLVRRLSSRFSVTVFQLHRRNPGYAPDTFELIDLDSGSSIVRALEFVYAFFRCHKKNPFQAVHGFWAMPCGFLAFLTGKLFGIKSIISLQGGDAIHMPEIGYGQLRSSWNRKLIFSALGGCTVLVSPTRFLMDKLGEKGFHRFDVRIVPLGIDSSLFTFREKEFHDPLRLLHIANFNLVKDQDTLLLAVNALKQRINFRLTIIGEGERKDHLEKKIQAYGLQEVVAFKRPSGYDAMVTHYHHADIFILSSRSEGHPIVVEEAVSCGVPVVGTRVGLLYDHPDLFLAAEPGDWQSLATKIETLASDPQLAKSLRARAKHWSDQHSIEWTIRELSAIYSQV